MSFSEQISTLMPVVTSTPSPVVDDNIRNLIDKDGLSAMCAEMYIPYVIARMERPDKFSNFVRKISSEQFVDAYPFWEEVL